MVAMAAKVTAMPASSGRPERINGWSERAKTKGSTGRMQGLRMVSTPPRYDRRNRIMLGSAHGLAYLTVIRRGQARVTARDAVTKTRQTLDMVR